MITAMDLAIHLIVLTACLSAALFGRGSLRTAGWAAFAVQSVRLQADATLIADAQSIASWVLYMASFTVLAVIRLTSAIRIRDGLRLPRWGWVLVMTMSAGAFTVVTSFGSSQIVALIAVRFALSCFLANLCLVAFVDMLAHRNAIPFALLLSDSADFLVLALALLTPIMSAGGAFVAMHAFEAVPWGFLGYLGYCGHHDFCALRGRGSDASLARVEK